VREEGQDGQQEDIKYIRQKNGEKKVHGEREKGKEDVGILQQCSSVVAIKG
jgi:hypothetical protein